MKRALALTCLVPFASACGPAVMVGRMAYFPPRPDDCSIELINGALQNGENFAKPDSPYQLAGTVALGEAGVHDPFADRYMAIVKPRACQMGGDAISLMSSQTISSPDLIRDGTSTAYVVLHKRAQETVVLGVSGGIISGTVAPKGSK